MNQDKVIDDTNLPLTLTSYQIALAIGHRHTDLLLMIEKYIHTAPEGSRQAHLATKIHKEGEHYILTEEFIRDLLSNHSPHIKQRINHFINIHKNIPTHTQEIINESVTDPLTESIAVKGIVNTYLNELLSTSPKLPVYTPSEAMRKDLNQDNYKGTFTDLTSYIHTQITYTPETTFEDIHKQVKGILESIEYIHIKAEYTNIYLIFTKV